MIRLDKESADRLLLGKTPREVYDAVRGEIEKAPDARLHDLFDTLEWVAANGYATADELDAVEEAEM